MSMFGKKDKGGAGVQDDLNDAIDSIDIDGDTAGPAAAAPRPPLPRGKKSSKGLLLLLLLAAAGGGAYYYMTSMNAPAPVPVDTAAAPAPETPADPNAAAATTAVDPVTGLPVETAQAAAPGTENILPGTTPTDATAAAAPAIDPITGLPVNPAPAEPAPVAAAPGEVDPVTGLPLDPVATGPAPAVTDPLAAPAATTAEATASATPDLPLPEDMSKAEATATDVTAPAVPQDINVTPGATVDPSHEPGSPQAIEAAKTPVVPPAQTTPAAKDITPVTGDAAQPPKDLPVPPVEAADAAGKPATNAKGGAPSAAEQAIVDNAPVLDQMGKPIDPPDLSTEISATPAIVRPLPNKYLVVKKDKGAGDMDSRLTAARLALSQGRDSTALALFTELSQDYPRDSRVSMGKAVALQRLGMQDQALEAYEEVLTKDPKNLEALTNMLGLLKGQDPKMALARLQELRDTYPSNADLTAQLGMSYGVAGDYKKSLQYLEMADALKPGSAFVTYNRAVVYDRMNNTAAAAQLYRQILDLAGQGRLDANLPLDSIRARLGSMH
jgi:Flp pilus assembly protein TadD